ncbi:MAG: DNA translocase FtsK 4TM domain-containing protein, partial [Solirubrobacteraceae bacterium]
MPAARRKPRARRSAPPSAWRVRLPALEQRHWDLIGLGLVAIGIFLVFLVYLGWDGGQAGSGLVDGLATLVGELHYLVPVALLAAGALVFMRDALPAVRPLRAAALCLGAAGCLALAAGTLGLGAGGDRVEDNGGYVGEGLYDAASALVGDVGAHIIAVFLFIAGILLLTGASVASVLRATGDSVTASGRAIRETAEPVRTAVQRRRTPREELDELEAAEPPTVTRTYLEQDFWSGPERFPDLYEGGPAPEPEPEPEPAEAGEPRLAEDPDTDEPGVVRGGTEVDPADLTPQGRLRRSVTDAPDFVWRVPDPGFLTRSGAEAAKPDTVGQEKVAAQLVEALGHFGVEARVIGMVAGPHITRYELRLAPGIKVGKVAQLKDDLAYALAA